MERNWLIRTSQNQILGPVAKQKLLEFVQKGALHLTDEVSSGNGYWFSLKEKDLVEKYLLGDLPQSYNPISESQTVLARKENPNKTTSINSAPVNQLHKNEDVTKVLKREDLKIPASEDLDYPDIALAPVSPKAQSDVKIPDASDLEFPDIEEISQKVQNSFEAAPVHQSGSKEISFEMEMDETTQDEHHQEDLTFVVSLDKLGGGTSDPYEKASNQEKVIYPDNDDLEFPDLFESTESPQDIHIDLRRQHTQTVALGVEQKEAILAEGKDSNFDKNNLTFEDDSEDLTVSVTLDVVDKTEVTQVSEEAPALTHLKKPKIDPRAAQNRAEEKFQLHDRKSKSSKLSGAALRDPNREVAHKQAAPAKKRNDTYLFFILILIVIIMVSVFYYFKEILNKPFPV